MTKEKAITIIETHKEHWQRLLREKICDETEGRETIEAFDMAISALSKNKGRWRVSHTDIDEVWTTCSNCGEEVEWDYSNGPYLIFCERHEDVLEEEGPQGNCPDFLEEDKEE